MAKVDARALKDEAAEAAGKGKWKRALECYLALEKLEKNDGLWAQKSADACKKLGRKDEAVAAFVRAADTYSRTGFLLKAVACCKLLLEIEPGHTATQERLASLHAARTGVPARPAASAPPPPPAPAPAPPPRPPAEAAAAPRVVVPPPPPVPAHAPPRAPLAALSLGKVVPDARLSVEMPAQSPDAPIYEIPLGEDDFEAEIAAFLDANTSEGAVVSGDDIAIEMEPDAAPSPQAVRAAVARTPLFSALDEAHLRRLIEDVRLVERAPGELVFSAGDPADALYVVASGEVAVVASDEAGAPAVEVARLGEGAFFGEIALLTDQPRSATVRAVVSTELLAIDRAVVAELASSSPEVLKVLLRFLRDRLLDKLTQTSPLFAPFVGDERRQLAGRFAFLEVEVGAVVVEQGKPAPGLFVVLSGSAEVSLGDRVIATLGPGDLFGEMSLLTRAGAVATIRARHRTLLLELPRAAFHSIIMTHPQILEYVNGLAEDRQARIDALLGGQAAYGEGHLRFT